MENFCLTIVKLLELLYSVSTFHRIKLVSTDFTFPACYIAVMATCEKYSEQHLAQSVCPSQLKAKHEIDPCSTLDRRLEQHSKWFFNEMSWVCCRAWITCYCGTRGVGVVERTKNNAHSKGNNDLHPGWGEKMFIMDFGGRTDRCKRVGEVMEWVIEGNRKRLKESKRKGDQWESSS